MTNGYDKRGYGGVVVDSRKRNGALGGVFTLAMIGVAGYLIWKYALDSPADLAEAQDGLANLTDDLGEKWEDLGLPTDFGNFTDVLGGLSDDLFAELHGGDPMLGDNTTLSWEDTFVQKDNGGLHLTLQNALDDTWQTEFEQAVADWKESDALQLTTERVAVDYNCGMVDGVMVVCNANFGATGWVGINENSIMRGVIVSSVAKMNEYYLRNAEFDHRRFTMCHEIGHGEYIDTARVCALRWMVCWVEGNFASLKPVVVVDVYKYFLHVPRVGVRVYNNRTPKNNLSPSVPKSHHQDSVYPTRTKIPTTPTWGTVWVSPYFPSVLPPPLVEKRTWLILFPFPHSSKYI